MIARREFLQAAVALPMLAQVKAGEAASLAGGLARTIFLCDAASLAAHSPGVPASVARAISTRQELFLAGAALQAQEAKPDEAAAIRAGQAALKAYAPLEPASPEERLAWDARLVRELWNREGGRGAAPSEREITDLFDTLNRRVLIAFHTYIPDDNDVEGWMVRLIRLHASMQDYWNRLAAAYLRVGPRADERYDAADPLIRASAALHHGSLNPALVAQAVMAQPSCAYGRALAAAHRALAEL